ncbi:MAG: CRTAC1 family protein [Planctomycetales bacterium]|nr:CRTAC1 family protein [Planctomycetales bacterium]
MTRKRSIHNNAPRYRVLLACVQALLIPAWGCSPQQQPNVAVSEDSAVVRAIPSVQLSRASAKKTDSIRFAVVTKQAGVDFTYYGGPSPEHYMTEQNGGGVGLLDFDGDGQLDIFFANGSHFMRSAEQAGATHQLYRAVGQLAYVEVSGVAGVDEFGFGMGCASGDYDNDGFVDLFLTQYGKNRLWHNNGDGTFSEVAASAGVMDDRWGTSAAFADLDGDGNLDLYVVNYVEWSPDDPPCYTQHQTPIQISCGPIGRAGLPDVLYHNIGDGTFRDVSHTAGIVRPDSKGLGLAIADFDDDGRLDIYVANDTTENFLFLNLGGMQFEEDGISNGVAVGSEGLAHSGMGVACGDMNNDGRFDLLVTNFDNEVNDLYQNLGPTGFLSVNQTFGLDPISRPMLGFGVVFSDFDSDGFLDLFVANGHVWDLTVLEMRYAYEMPPQVIRNIDAERFADVSASAGSYFQQLRLGRGVAVGDLDGDGDEDLVVTQIEAPAELLRNDSERLNATCRLRLVGTSSSRQPLGCHVEVVIGGHVRTYWVPSGGSFQSASDTQFVIVTGQADMIDEVTIQWPGQRRETWWGIRVESSMTLIQGTGLPEAGTRP